MVAASTSARLRTATLGPGFDEVAVQRAVSGEPPARLTHRERRQAIEVCTRRGLSVRETAERVGCSPRTVLRVRARQRGGDDTPNEHS
ncbi:helix-turn-helix domain-containing protein [Streptomyces cellulosae]|uniref:Helix-turn-helix domain-containing protein n=1 Tax=Streptomyces cellulosae TaxID=1968 RepID=A0ABW6JJ09_STRCE